MGKKDGQEFYRQTAMAIATYLLQELKMNPGEHWKVRNATNGPRVLTLNLMVNPRYAGKIMGMSEALSMAAGLDKDVSIRASRGSGGVLALEVPKPEALWFNFSVGNLPRRRGLLAPVGLDGDHRPATVDFANPLTNHALVAGLSGSGKTNLERVLAYQLVMQNQPEDVQFLLFDVADAGLAWVGFEDVPHLMHGVVTDVATALSAVNWLQGEMERRAEARCFTPRLFCFIDEIQELALEKQFVRPVERLARRGRKWGINLVLATQRPTKDSMGSLNIKANLGLRLVGKVTSGQESAWATDLSEVGCEKLVGAGDFVMVKPGGVVQRMATPLLADDDVAKLPSNGAGRIELPGLEEEQIAGDFDAMETVLSLIAAQHGKGRPWLKNVLEAEGRSKPGSKRASRLLAWGREFHKLLGRYHYRLALID